jgi:iodotyrosine deiodinase
MSYIPIPLPDRMHFTDDEIRQRAGEFYDEIRLRHTVRDFSSKPVARDVIETCLRAAGTAPSGANHQPWHFAVVGDPELKARIRAAAEREEQEFYAGRAGDEWLGALKPIGTDANKPFLEIAPWLIIIFGERKGYENGRPRKNYYVPESVCIATGFLIAALHHAGLATLTHTPNPMSFLNELLGRPGSDKPYILLVVGHPAENATIPEHAAKKKPLHEIASFR